MKESLSNALSQEFKDSIIYPKRSEVFEYQLVIQSVMEYFVSEFRIIKHCDDTLLQLVGIIGEESITSCEWNEDDPNGRWVVSIKMSDKEKRINLGDFIQANFNVFDVLNAR